MLKNLKLKYSILLGYAVPIILTLVVAIVVYANVKKAEEQSRIFEAKYQRAEKFSRFAISALEMQNATRGYLLVNNETFFKSYEEGDKHFLAYSESLEQLIKDPKQMENFRRIGEVGKHFRELTREIISLAHQGKRAEAVELFQTKAPYNLAMELNKGIGAFQEEEIDSWRINNNAMSELVNVLISSVLLAIIFAMLLGLWVASRINRTIREAVKSVSTTSTEIAATISRYDNTSQQLAVMVTESAITMEQLAVSSRQTAGQATSTSEMAKNATLLAKEGNASVRQSIGAMESLKIRIEEISGQILSLCEQTGQIGGIAELVKDLSSQINMLALNAAVEAARAGEHGKGFAVVAAEVRKLSVESKKSAEQARVIVSYIQKASDASIMKTGEGMKNIENVVENAQKVRELFDALSQVASQVFLSSQEVMENAKQQSSAIAQVVEATNTINVGAKETAEGVSQVKTGVENINRSTDKLLRMV